MKHNACIWFIGCGAILYSICVWSIPANAMCIPRRRSASQHNRSLQALERNDTSVEYGSPLKKSPEATKEEGVGRRRSATSSLEVHNSQQSFCNTAENSKATSAPQLLASHSLIIAKYCQVCGNTIAGFKKDANASDTCLICYRAHANEKYNT